MHGRYGTTTGQHIMNEHLRRLAICAASVIAAIAGALAVASAAVNEKVNFQPSLSTVPAGYTADSGAAYSEATGRGWCARTASTPRTTCRSTSPRTRASATP